MEDPWLAGAFLAADAQQGVEGFDEVDNQGFGELFAEADMASEKLFLDFHGGAAEGVEAGFADGEDLRGAGEGFELLHQLGSIGARGAPGVQAEVKGGAAY